MITVYNDKKADLWNRLFEAAENVLNFGKDSGAEKETITSIDAYFAKLKTILEKAPDAEVDPAKFILLPVDENPCEIDADTRTITIPADFAKCAGVIGDNYCEIVTFTIDRYFDFQDLYNTDISVHWENPEKVKGITEIELIDVEFEYGKIRFGWPLTSNITTRTSGNIKFSVQFSKKEEEGGVVKTIYVLNTLPATLPIKAGLIVDNPEYTENNVADSIYKYIVNSRDLQYPVPVLPQFIDEYNGYDLPENANLIDNKLTLNALAIAPDYNNLEYTWYRKQTLDGVTTEKILRSDEFYEIKDGYVITKDELVDTRKTYYTLVGDEYVEITTKSNINYSEEDNKLVYENKDVFEKGTSLYIRQIEKTDSRYGTAITGEYWVSAQSANEKNTSQPMESTHCEIAKPAKVTIENIPENIILTKNAETGEVEPVEITASILPAGSICSWFKIDQNGENPEILNKKDDGITVEITEPGWYQVEGKIELNRFVEDNTSNLCRVVNAPEAPVITSVMFGADNLMEGDGVDLNAGDLEDKSLKAGETAEVTVNISLDTNNRLLSDRVTYQWYLSVNNGTFTLLDETTNKITVAGVDSGVNNRYYCVVTNELAGEKASSNSGTFAIYNM